jgi:amino acid permease
MGVFMGICVILFAGATSGMGLYFLSRCALRIERGHSSFFAVAKRTYPDAAVVFDSAIAIKCFGTAVVDCADTGVAVSYLIIIGDLMPQVIGSIFPGSKSMPFLLDRQFWITTFMYILRLAHPGL